MSTNPIVTITREEEDKLISYLSTPHRTTSGTFRTLRNKLAVLLMLDAGLRVGEVVKLPHSTFYFSGEPVRNLIIPASISKNKSERVIPVSPRLRAILADWQLLVRRNQPYYNTTWSQHTAAQPIPLSTRQLERIVKAAAITAFGRPIHPHVLRHTFATKLMRIAPMPVVQALLGHKHLSSTQVYVHPNSDDLTAAISQLHPPRPATTAPHSGSTKTHD